MQFNINTNPIEVNEIQLNTMKLQQTLIELNVNSMIFSYTEIKF